MKRCSNSLTKKCELKSQRHITSYPFDWQILRNLMIISVGVAIDQLYLLYTAYQSI